MTTTNFHPDDAPVFEAEVRGATTTARAFVDVLSDGTTYTGIAIETHRTDGPMLTLDLSDAPEAWMDLARICGDVAAVLRALATTTGTATGKAA